MYRIFVAIMFSIIVEMANSVFYCPDGWTRFETKCYFKDAKLVTRDQNKRNCETMKSGMVSIRNKGENEFMKDFIRGDFYYWLSGERVQRGSNLFKWSDGTSMNFTDWNKGEPNDVDNKKRVCVDMHSESSWNDFVCDDTLGQLCEKRALEIDCAGTPSDKETKKIMKKECPKIFRSELIEKGKEIDDLRETVEIQNEEIKQLQKVFEIRLTDITRDLYKSIAFLKSEIELVQTRNKFNSECCSTSKAMVVDLEKKILQAAVNMDANLAQLRRTYPLDLPERFASIESRMDRVDQKMGNPIIKLAGRLG